MSDASKPRLWWVHPSDLQHEKPVFFVAEDEPVHVIEKSAYDAAIKERDEARVEVAQLKSDMHVVINQHADTIKERDEARAEIAEQCRLNGMGQERELKLMAEIERLKASLSVYFKGVNACMKDSEALTAERAKVARLREALVNIEICSSRDDASYQARQALEETKG